MSAAYFSRTAQFNDRSDWPEMSSCASLYSDENTAFSGGIHKRRLTAFVGSACLLVLSLGLFACEESFEGPPEIVPARLTVSLDSLVVLNDGDSIDLQPPIQGGWVLFVGAVVRNVSQRGGSLLGELKRAKAPDGSPLAVPGGVLYSDERTAPLAPLPSGFAPPRSDGAAPWYLTMPNPNDTSNIATCPNPLDLDIVDGAFYLQVTYRDKLGRTASSYRKVIPRCTQADPQAAATCRCECSANYQPEKCAVR